MELYLSDKVQSWTLTSDGAYNQNDLNDKESLGVQSILQKSLGRL